MRIVVTGGAGFIGSNLTLALACLGHSVVIVDDLSRRGSERNLRRLLDNPEISERVTFRKVDIRDVRGCSAALTGSVRPADAVLHLAGQTTVTESLTNPLDDFDINARGTLNLLEATRTHAPEAHFIFASTNKVYGDLKATKVERHETRYRMLDYPEGIPEGFPTGAVSPYGCSKLAGDCYVRDYGRTFGMDTTVLRLSCIYGNWQNGMAGQGWVSWLVKSALNGSGVTIYGDGIQTRDLLHIDDLVSALLTVIVDRRGIGETFNVGGGPRFTISLWAEFGPLLERILRRTVPVRYEARRLGDQDVYVSDIRKLSSALSWSPRKSPEEGVAELVQWLTVELGLTGAIAHP